MAKSLTEILGGRNMTGVVQTVATGLPNYIPAAFQATTKRVIGNKSTFFKTQGQRGNIRLVQYGAPAIRTGRIPLSEAGATLLHAFEEQSHDPLILQNLMGLNGEPAANLATEEVDRQTVNLKQRTENARLSSLYSVLRYGKIYVDGNGAILFTSSGAVTTVDYGVPAGNMDQIGGIISASWGTASTPIIDNINAIKKKAVQTTGRELKYAMYGANILGYLTTNTQAKELLNNTPMLAEKIYNTGEIPDGFMGMTWVPMYKAFGLNQSDAVTDWWGGDIITMSPVPDGNWWQFHEGSYLIPRNVGTIYADAMAAVRDLDQVYGQFAYGVVTHNPVTVMQYIGDTWMPILASPNDLYIVDVTP